MKLTSKQWKTITLVSGSIFIVGIIANAIPALKDSFLVSIGGFAFIVAAFSLYKLITVSKREKAKKIHEEYLKQQNELFLKRKAAFEQHLENSDVKDQLILKLKAVKRGDRQENIDNVKIFDKLQLNESIDSDSFDISSTFGIIGRTSVTEGKKIQDLGDVSAYYIERLESDDRLGMKIMVIKN